jgi:excisionase family DNA binding protein
MEIIQLSRAELNDLVIELKKHITEELKSLKEKKAEQPLSPKEAAKYLKISMGTYYCRVKTGEIPERLLHRKGRKVQLFESELEHYIKES